MFAPPQARHRRQIIDSGSSFVPVILGCDAYVVGKASDTVAAGTSYGQAVLWSEPFQRF